MSPLGSVGYDISRPIKYVYFFGRGKADGDATMKDLLGGKGANLAEMTNLGMPVPPGLTVTADVCKLYFKHGNQLPPDIKEEVERQIFADLARVEEITGRRFGDPRKPLLVSVRSGAKYSMPGMMNTILDVGLNDMTVEGLAEESGDRRFAYDCYRRFIQMFGEDALDINKKKFNQIFDARKERAHAKQDKDLTAEDLKEIIESYKELVQVETGGPVPQDVNVQLLMALYAVFRSWNSPRAIYTRETEQIPDTGTAGTIQAMVFGNLGEQSGTGVAFSRSSATGEKETYGEFLMAGQGEDVVAGARTPRPISELKRLMPGVYDQLQIILDKLEKHHRDMRDVEFTIQEGKLYMLQDRTGKRSGLAAVRVAVDMANEELISRQEAVLRVDPGKELDQLLHPVFDENSLQNVTLLSTSGIAAGPGAAVGRAAFTVDDAVEMSKVVNPETGKVDPVILVRIEPTPDDVQGLDVAVGILTGRGGTSSHAALVARGKGKVCVVGADSIKIDEDKKQYTTVAPDGQTYTVKQGEWISLDGTAHKVYLGKAETVEAQPELVQQFNQLMDWEKEFRGDFGVRTNADDPDAAKTARREALDKLLPMQRGDFVGLFREMNGHPVTIRTLDPPLHEFLPDREDLIVDCALLQHMNTSKEVSLGVRVLRAIYWRLKGMPTRAKMAEKYKKYGIRAEELDTRLPVLLKRVNELHEFNPMLGFRGCRLGIAYPEITEMQARAIFEAVVQVYREGIKVSPEVMIPLVNYDKEFDHQREIVDRVAKEVLAKEGLSDLPYTVGTMIELPRAALTADEIAKHAEFFSFGTNDLTQTGLGFSRDDARRMFFGRYRDLRIFDADPFESIDQSGIGKLIKMGIELGRKVRAKIKIGICGEHGGDPSSIDFCYRAGMNYVSCSPFRVPVARLAAAQAAIRAKMATEASSTNVPQALPPSPTSAEGGSYFISIALAIAGMAAVGLALLVVWPTIASIPWPSVLEVGAAGGIAVTALTATAFFLKPTIKRLAPALPRAAREFYTAA